jgi:hypothetical protein
MVFPRKALVIQRVVTGKVPDGVGPLLSLSRPGGSAVRLRRHPAFAVDIARIIFFVAVILFVIWALVTLIRGRSSTMP